MKSKADIVKQIIEQLSSSDQETVKNELLGWLLFSEFRNEADGKFNQLTAHEQELIKKLAEQAEALRKIMKNGE